MDWEFYILNQIRQNWTSDFFDTMMLLISLIGNGILWVLTAVICLVFKKTRPFGRSLTASLLMGLVTCSLILKPIVQRIRPYDLNQTISIIVQAEKDFSFPSGHTFFAFGTATIIFMYNKALGIAAYLFAALIAFSRLYLYVHFPTDIICGMIFGILIAVAAYKIEKMLFVKTYTPKMNTYE